MVEKLAPMNQFLKSTRHNMVRIMLMPPETPRLWQGSCGCFTNVKYWICWSMGADILWRVDGRRKKRCCEDHWRNQFKKIIEPSSERK